MKLHWSPRSPFVRKVMIALHETGRADEVECIRSAVAMAAAPNPQVLADNPLGKIPTLVLADGTAIFDSRVICEYLDSISRGARLFPASPAARLQQLRWQALGDGLTDLLLLWRIETSRGTHSDPRIENGFDSKTRTTLDFLEREAARLSREPFGIGHAAIICALGQLNFRYADCGWEKAHPELATWYQTLQARPSVAATRIKDDDAVAVVGNFHMSLRFE